MADAPPPAYSELTITSSNPTTPYASEATDQLIIGLDFGTTFSGIAWAITPQLTVQAITDWPGLEGHSQPKVPTVISYDPLNNKSFAWGGQKTKWPVIEAVKLLLDPDQPVPYYLPGAKRDLAKLKEVGKSAVDVAADYIGAIYKHALSQIESKIPGEFYSRCQKKFVISVPAVWSEKARADTEKAARLAGIHPVHMVREPEAAALYTLHVNERALKVNDAFVVCDAGGGTVDLISYEVKQVHPRLEVGELVPCKGGMSGSLGLNRRFADAVRDIVGEDDFVVLKKERGYERALNQFDRDVKTAFQGEPDEDYFVNFPLTSLKNDKENGISDKTWHMKSKDVKDIFEPLIEDIIGLVKTQVDAVRLKRIADNHPKRDEIKAIFLVGGFGSSLYLKQRIQAVFEDIQILQPVDAWSAVVKGAVLQMCPQQAAVVNYIAQKHYGVQCFRNWDDSRDKGQTYFWNPRLWKYEALTMTWYIYQHDDLQRDRTIEFPFYVALEADYTPNDLVLVNELTESEQSQPPQHPQDGLTKTNVTLTSDLRNLDARNLKETTGKDGKTYYEVHYKLTMRVAPALFKFGLEIDGKEIGTVDASYS